MTDYRIRVVTIDGRSVKGDIDLSAFSDLEAKAFTSAYLRGWLERGPTDIPHAFELLADTLAGPELVGDGRVEQGSLGRADAHWTSFTYRRRFSDTDCSVDDPHDVPRAAYLGKPPPMDPDLA
jgi:hypothetical protein